MEVSAYVPCYNAEASIRDALQSIRDQTAPAAEIFVIDDGSTDGSEEISGVRVVRFESNQGRGAVRARAMAEAKHELVLACDATLRLDRKFLEAALSWFADAKVGATFGWVKEAARSKSVPADVRQVGTFSRGPSSHAAPLRCGFKLCICGTTKWLFR
jgi:Glycosyltransferases involved in cell wall biogenesis